MNTTLLIPALFPAFAPGKELRLPALERILTRGRWTRLEAQSVTEDWQLSHATTRAQSLQRSSGYWLCADPAHVRVEGSRALLMDSGQLDISMEEAKLLVESLNHHFEQDDLRFFILNPRQWLVESGQPIGLDCTWPPLWCAGRNLEPWLPQGPDQTRWRRHFNEIQMLLFEHPVNQARQKNSQPTLDALWFWNRGNSAQTHPTLVDTLRRPAAYEDLDAWQNALTALDAEVFAPLLEQMHRGEIKSLTLLCPEGERNYSINLKGAQLRWHFWKIRQPLVDYYDHHHATQG